MSDAERLIRVALCRAITDAAAVGALAPTADAALDARWVVTEAAALARELAPHFTVTAGA